METINNHTGFSVSAPFKVKDAVAFEAWASELSIVASRCPRQVGSTYYTIAPLRGADWSNMHFPPDVADTEGVGLGHWFAHELGKHIAAGVVVIYDVLGADKNGTTTWVDVTITMIAPNGSFDIYGPADLAALAIEQTGWQLGIVDIYDPGLLGRWSTQVTLPEPAKPQKDTMEKHTPKPAYPKLKASCLGRNAFMIINGKLVVEVTGNELALEGHPPGKLVCQPWTPEDSLVAHPDYDVLGVTVSRSGIMFHDKGAFYPETLEPEDYEDEIPADAHLHDDPRTDSRIADSEGWGLYTSGILMIQRNDEDERFDSDDAAIQFVRMVARYSPYHAKAMAIHAASNLPQEELIHTFDVTVAGCTAEQAAQVMQERLGHDEDYGFNYTLNW